MTERSHVYRTHALILRRRDYADADRVLTIFSPQYGRLEVIAKGVRKTTSRKAGHLEPFTHSNLMLAQARTWDIVTEAVTVESYRHLRADLDAISRAGFIAELIDAFAESDDDHRPLWELATDSLRELDAACVAGSTVDREVLLQWFVLHLLSITGFEPQLFSCLECEEELQPVTNFVSLIEGGVLCPKCGANRSELEAVEPEILKVLRYLQSRGWGEARGLTLRPQTVRRVENLLGRYLITILERQLRSTDFLRRIRSDPRFSG